MLAGQNGDDEIEGSGADASRRAGADTGSVHRRLTALLTALLLIGLTAAAVVFLLRLAGNDDATAASTTTLPSVGVDTETGGGPSPGPDTSAPPTTAADPDDEGPPVVLRGDGLGALAFGAPTDEVIVGLTLRWGPPTSDSGWITAGSSPYGVCPGTEVRGVAWGSFSVLFSDGPTPHGPAGQRHFLTWQYLVDDVNSPGPDPGGNRPPLRTAKGVSVGARVSDLQAAYGTGLELFDEPPAGPQFGVQLPDGGLFGSVTGFEPGDVVLSIVGGGGCGE